MAIYASLIFANLWATTDRRPRIAVAAVSGSLHLGFAGLHLYRLYRPFRFEVFSYPWPFEASLREAVILSMFGTLSLFVAVNLRQKRIGAYQSAPRTREVGAPPDSA
jgi:hypothetical protein